MLMSHTTTHFRLIWREIKTAVHEQHAPRHLPFLPVHNCHNNFMNCSDTK